MGFIIYNFVVNFIKGFIKKYFSAQVDAEESILSNIFIRFAKVGFGFFILAIVIIIRLLIIAIDTPKYQLSKTIKVDLEKAILLDCNYDDLKIIYDKKELTNMRTNFIRNSDFHDVKVGLTYILEDMIFDYYAHNLKDSIYIFKLKYFIKESKEKHPFDKLDESQKELFIALRDNSGETYPLIKDNLLNISEELNSKNITIDKYLDKSNQSYILSIIALLVTLFQTTPSTWRMLKRYVNTKGKMNNLTNTLNNKK